MGTHDHVHMWVHYADGHETHFVDEPNSRRRSLTVIKMRCAACGQRGFRYPNRRLIHTWDRDQSNWLRDLDMHDLDNAYYASEAYYSAIDGACTDAGLIDDEWDLSDDEWDKRFVAALLERGLKLVQLNAVGEKNKPFPYMAPKPCTGGFPYPSYIVRVRP